MKSLAEKLCEIFAGHYMKGEPTDRAWSAVARYVRRLVREAERKPRKCECGNLAETECIKCYYRNRRNTHEVTTAPGTLGAVVVPVSWNGGPSENASPLVRMIGRLALRARYEDVCKPQVGDTVVEVTHLMVLARHGLGLLSAVGELLKVEQIEGEGEVYTIRTVEGVEQRWFNAMVYVVERRHNASGEA